ISEASVVTLWRTGLFALSVEMMTQRLTTGSFLNSGIGVTTGSSVFRDICASCWDSPEVLGKEIKLGRPLPGSLRPRALHGVKVLLELEGKSVELLVNKAFSKKRSPGPEQRNRHRQRCSI